MNMYVCMYVHIIDWIEGLNNNDGVITETSFFSLHYASLLFFFLLSFLLPFRVFAVENLGRKKRKEEKKKKKKSKTTNNKQTNKSLELFPPPPIRLTLGKKKGQKRRG